VAGPRPTPTRQRDTREDEHHAGDRARRDRLVEQRGAIGKRDRRREVGHEGGAPRAQLSDELVEDHERRRRAEGAEADEG
jgi:hypothetical protein